VTEARKLVSVLFADVVDSTVMGATHDPELVRSVMAGYFARMKDIAETHGGTVEKFIGDAIMVVFGVPRMHEDDAERAVRAALAMRDAVAETDPQARVALAIRVGVNSGEVVAGVGDANQFLVTGDAVNLAARLQQGADAGEVIVGALTAHLTRDAIRYAPHEPIAAKGVARPLVAHIAIRANESRPAAHGGAPAELAAFTGRDAELRHLLDVFARAQAARSSHLVTIIGNAGVGKSRLVAQAMAALMATARVHTLRGRCLPYGTGITYWPLMDILREDAGIRDSDDRAAALARLDARLAAVVGEDRRAAVQARVAVLLGLEEPNTALPTVPAERIAVELSWGVRQYVEALVARGPLVVIIDDLQWADPAVLAVLEALAGGSGAGAFLLLCLARPELLERHPAWSAGRVDTSLLALEPLGETDAQTLVTKLLGIDNLPPDFASSVAARAAGNPLFCEELVRMLVETGYLRLVDSRWHVTGPSTDLPLPETIAAIVAARIDGLPQPEKEALQRASVIGERFGLDDLLALGGTLGDAPEALLRKGLFAPDRDDPTGRSLRFKHLLIRDAAYGSLPKADRAGLHHQVGILLETAVSDRHGEFSELLAYHAAQSYQLSRDLGLTGERVAERTERALRWSQVAGDRALAVYATEQGARHYALALEIAIRQPDNSTLLEHLFVARGRALELRGAYDDAIQTYESFEHLAAERGDERMRADALARQATIYRTATTRFDAERADALLDAALRIARALDDPTLIAQLQRDRIHIRLYRGDVEQAIAVGEESIAAAVRSGSHEQLMYTLNDMVCAYREAPDEAKGRQAAYRASELADELDNKPIAVNSRSTLGLLEFTVGDYDTALRLQEEATTIAEGIDNYWGRSISAGGSGWPKFERGDFGQAILAWEESLRLAAAVGFLAPTALYQADLAWCYRSAGADEEARRHLDAAHELVEARFPFWRAWTLGHLSRSATAGGAIDLARGYLERAREALVPRTEWSAFQHAQIGLAAAELELASGAFAAAADAAIAGGEQQRRRMRPYIADFEYLEGEAYRRNGDLDRAAEALGRARATASELGGRRVLWHILASLASVEDARGNVIEGAAAGEAARTIATAIEDSLRVVGLADRFREHVAMAELSGG